MNKLRGLTNSISEVKSSSGNGTILESMLHGNSLLFGQKIPSFLEGYSVRLSFSWIDRKILKMFANLAPRRNFVLAGLGQSTVFLGPYLSFSKSSELSANLTTASVPLFRDQYQLSWKVPYDPVNNRIAGLSLLKGRCHCARLTVYGADR